MSNRSVKLWLSSVSMSMIAVLLIAACAPIVVQQSPQEASGSEPAEKITVKLAENPWSGSQVNVAVARILLEEEMG
ncbi:MAG: glycine/betaine ABC transporter substrate-binding protein, partial [Anaerolineae bacterium]|nr:glycine/betaine ABC transporter substrate-binding protein [Anaerolineae bacterium]